MHRSIALGLSFLTLLSAACASDGTNDDSGNGGSAVLPTTTNLTPENGGTVGDQSGPISLVVPAGAVAEAVEVTLSVEAKTAETATSVYRFSPEATSFSVAAILRISTAGAPTDTVLSLAQYGDGVWIPVGDAIEQSGSIEVPITRLGSFAIISTEPSTQGQCDASCLAQSGAMCCTECGCDVAIACEPVCGDGQRWDCELTCCFDTEAFACVE